MTPPQHIAPPADGIPMPRRIWAILAVAFGVSLSVIDSTIANVALPTISRALGISSADSIWVVNAYQLAIVVSLLSFSALGDLVGYRKIYIGGLALFTAASVGCALSQSLGTLVAGRVLQGFGAAAVTSVNTTLIRIIYPRNRLGRGMGINATVVAVSSVAGPTLAAGVLSAAEWPWLFAVNIPVGLVALALSRRFLPANPVRVRDRRFDWRDAAMNALVFGLLMASVEGFSHGLDPRIVALGAAVLVPVGFVFIRRQLREPYPILPFDLLRIPIFSVSVLTSICSFLAQMLAMVALPFYLQHACGYDDVATGLLLTAWPAVIMVVAPVAGLLVERVHAGLLGGTGLAAMAAGLLLLVTKPYRLGYLKLAAPYLCEQDAALFLSYAWISTESPNDDPNLSKRSLLAMFRSIDPQMLMDEEERGLFQSLDDVVTVYRGGTSYNAQNVKALSWTLNREVAEWFAHRFGQNGTVYEAQVKKENIYAVFLGRNEEEVIVDPERLMGLSQLPEQEQGQGQGMEISM